MEEINDILDLNFPTIARKHSKDLERDVIEFNGVIHYRELFHILKHVRLIKMYILRPSDGTTKIILH